jgi:hypothetical protein
VAVLAEKDKEGKPSLPVYYKSRIYIDLSDSDSYASNFDQLLRWIFDKPLYIKPPIGKPPAFLKDNSIALGTQSRSRRSIELIRSGAPNAAGALDEYLSTLATELDRFRIPHDDPTTRYDELVINNIAAFVPYRDEYVEVVSVLARYWPLSNGEHRLQKFLETIALYLFRPKTAVQWSDTDFDNFSFIIHELFLYTTAILIHHERFSAVDGLLTAGYYLGATLEHQSDPVQEFVIFRGFLKTFEIRKQRLQLNRLSLRADLLQQRAQSSGVSFELVMQADFVLFLRSCVNVLKSSTKQWWPETLIYAERHGPFEIFARAQSVGYFDRVKEMLGVCGKDELKQVLSQIRQDRPPYLPTWQIYSIDPRELAGMEKIATRP